MFVNNLVPLNRKVYSELDRITPYIMVKNFSIRWAFCPTLLYVICPVSAVCPDPDSPVHGTVTVTLEELVGGATATYACDAGYTLIGPSEVICQLVDGSDPVWSDEPPVCCLRKFSPYLYFICQHIVITCCLTLLHSQRPKLYTILAFLSLLKQTRVIVSDEIP